MVWARLAAVLAVLGVAARGACGLSLEGVRAAHASPRPLPLPSHRRLPLPRDPDLMDDQPLPLLPGPAPPRYEEALALSEALEGRAVPNYRLERFISELADAITQEDLTEALTESLTGALTGKLTGGLTEGGYGALPMEVEALDGTLDGVPEGRAREMLEVLGDGADGVVPGAGPWEETERGFGLLPRFLSRRPGAEPINNNNNNNNNNNRKARDSRNSRSITTPNNNPNPNNNNNNSSSSSSTTLNTQSGSITNTNNNLAHHPNSASHRLPNSHTSGMYKRAWPPSFSRRRNSGLSLSIDASMKVLREALYLEIARKKQRQQLQRAQHNKALLNTIGKRDVASQLVQGGRDVTFGDRN